MFTINYVKHLERLANFCILVAIIGILLETCILQFVYHELPCPLCLLQRIGFIGIVFCFLLNFRFGLRPSHYSLAIISSLFSAFVALRQIALHVIPGTGHYGSPILGLHLYTWSFIAAMAILIATAVLLSIDKQFENPNRYQSKSWQFITNILFGCVSAVIAVNLIAVILQCGFKECAANPKQYELIKELI